MGINKSLGEKIACFSMASMILFGGFVPNTVAAEAKTSVDMNIAEPKQEPSKVEVVDTPDKKEVMVTQTEEKVKAEKALKVEEKSQQKDKAIEKVHNKTASKLLKDMKSGDEFSFGGRLWVLITPAQGYAMTKEKITDMKLEKADFDKGNPNEILQYFDSVYYNKLSKKDASLMESKTFGLTNFDEGLHVTAKFKAVAGLTREGSLSLQDVSKITKETEKPEKDTSKEDKFILMGAISVICLLGILLFVYVFNPRRKNKESK